jgi:hypothetical protein
LSQVHVPNNPDVLQIKAKANGTSTSSGSNYDVEFSDTDIWETNFSRGSSISVASSGDKIDIEAGLYQINFSGWVQNAGAIYGSSDLVLQIATDPNFIATNILYDRNIMYFGESGDSSLVTGVYDFTQTALFNTTTSTSIYVRIKNTNGASENFYLRGDATSNITIFEVLRISGAIA